MKLMPYIAPEVVQEVKRMDLLTVHENYEPQELVHFSGNTYTTKKSRQSEDFQREGCGGVRVSVVDRRWII